ncbi:MAG: hypothetical protein HYZ14_14595 [Bacteroidetes bacterium]|nr:hypothetical protein [Bacteroidota bacterium]
MKLFKKLDNYLLHYYPTIWITRIHSFLPIGLGIALVLFLITLSVGWNPKNELPDNVIPVVLMIIPVLIYLVYWFIFQSRYNVAKSGGRMPLSFEYLNFFSYLLVFFMAFLIISAIPLANYQRVKNAIDTEKFAGEMEMLNNGNTLVFGASEITFNDNGTISYYRSEFTYQTYFYDYDYEYYPEYGAPGPITVSRNQAEQIISDFIKVYNTYSNYPITRSSSEILTDQENGNASDFLYNDPYYYDNSWDVQYKLSQISTRMNYGWFAEYAEPWFWKIVCGIMAFLAMLVWIFKQMNLRQFVYGFITICLTPLLIAIIGVILFELLQIRNNEEVAVSTIALLLYMLFATITIRTYLASTLNNAGYVITMYLQFFLPLLPLFAWMFFFDTTYYDYTDNLDYVMNFLYWSGWVIGVLSIAVFKPLYSKFRSLPSKN